MARSKVKKAIRITAVVVAALIAISLLTNFFSRTDFGSRLIFELDYLQLQNTANYLDSLKEYDSSIFITLPFAKMMVAPGEYKEIDDIKIKVTLFMLFLKGYDNIGKNDTTIYFDRWNDGFERFRGYALSLDKSGQIIVDFVIDQKQMSKEDWYLYYDDYNKWRVMKTR